MGRALKLSSGLVFLTGVASQVSTDDTFNLESMETQSSFSDLFLGRAVLSHEISVKIIFFFFSNSASSAMDAWTRRKCLDELTGPYTACKSWCPS